MLSFSECNCISILSFIKFFVFDFERVNVTDLTMITKLLLLLCCCCCCLERKLTLVVVGYLIDVYRFDRQLSEKTWNTRDGWEDKLRVVQGSTEIITDLGKWSEMITFESILTTFEASIRFTHSRLSLGESSEAIIFMALLTWKTIFWAAMSLPIIGLSL